MHLIDGRQFEARIKNFDRFAVIVEVDGADQLIFKHAIATIATAAVASRQLLRRPHHALTALGQPCRFRFRRVILIVLDSVGIGELPDAAAYGDEGSNTLGNIAQARSPAAAGPAIARPRPPRDARRGAPAQPPRGAFGRMAEASPGKDSVTGHWEMMGIVLDRPFPTFPHGFPAERRSRSSSGASAAATLGNVVASGTEIIDRLGPEHVRTGKPIVYTSADSVFQIAAHEDVIPIDELYRICEIAFDLVGRGHGRRPRHRAAVRRRAGSVHADGEPARLRARADRRDAARRADAAQGTPVVAIGKINDLFAGPRHCRALSTPSSDADGMDRLDEAMRRDARAA